MGDENPEIRVVGGMILYRGNPLIGGTEQTRESAAATFGLSEDDLDFVFGK